MPRVARIVVPGLAHHVTQRGNNRQDVFFCDDDRKAYLTILARQCQLHGVAIVGYCLMTNHVHHLAIPARADSLAKALGRTHWLYTQYVNRLHKRSGHLWQNRFYSSAVDDEHALLVMRYIENNPRRAGMCRVASKYAWSSAAVHCGGREEIALLDRTTWKRLSRGLDWSEELSEPLNDAQVQRVRRSTHTGRPLGSDSFLSKLESKLGRRLRPLAVGRPRRKTAKPPRKRRGKNAGARK